MRIHRYATDQDGFRYRNEMLQDERLSWAARGLLVELLSKPDGWHSNADEIAREARRSRGDKAGEGRAAIRALFAELERYGYMTRQKTHDAQGRMTTVLEVYDTPQHEEVDAATVRKASSPRYPRGDYLYRHWDNDGRLLYVGIASMGAGDANQGKGGER